MLLAEVTGASPDYGYALRLGIIGVVLVAAPFVLYGLHRSGTTLGEAGRRSAALLVMAHLRGGHAGDGQWVVRRSGRRGASSSWSSRSSRSG